MVKLHKSKTTPGELTSYLPWFLNVVVKTIRVQIHVIYFTFSEADIRIFEIKITAWSKHE